MSTYGLYLDRNLEYPNNNPAFRPSTLYPEYRYGPSAIASNSNAVYDSFRKLLIELKLDYENIDSPNWNPLGCYISPGQKVLIKPNWVMDHNLNGGGLDCLYTHSSLIAAVVDYALIALAGSGRVLIADAPMQSCDFEKLQSNAGMPDLVNFYLANNENVGVKDLRGLTSKQTSFGLEQHVDPSVSGTVVDLGNLSCFADLSEDRIRSLRITNYPPEELSKHHRVGVHEYSISEDLLSADIVINMPKGKTHRKAGLTGALKNMVGVNVRKEYLPHHSVGPRKDGYDEYESRNRFRVLNSRLFDKRNSITGASTLSRARKMFYKVLAHYSEKAISNFSTVNYIEGSWWGNDTIWRTIIDINRIVFHADAEGVLHNEQVRDMLVIGDFVVAGEGDGPLMPTPIEMGGITFSDSPIVHDIAMTQLMGYKPSYFPSIHCAVSNNGVFTIPYSDECICCSNDSAYDGVNIEALPAIGEKKAVLPPGWDSIT